MFHFLAGIFITDANLRKKYASEEVISAKTIYYTDIT